MRSQLTEKQITHLRDALQKRYGELLDEVEKLEAGATRSPNGSVAERQADEGSVVDAQDHDFDLLEHEDGILRDISRALQRMDEGSYGRCSECERSIAIERLEALPHTDLCIVCAAAAEASDEEELEA